MHANSADILIHFVKKYAPNATSILDVGSRRAMPDQSTVREELLRGNAISRSAAYLGIDVVPGSGVDRVVEPYDWKLDVKFDLVVSANAFEHIEWPWMTMVEISKVLAPDGHAVLHAPGLPILHDWPGDCWRIMPDGWRAMAKWANLTILETDLQPWGEWWDTYAVYTTK